MPYAIGDDQVSCYCGTANVRTKHSVIMPSIVKSANREIHGSGLLRANVRKLPWKRQLADLPSPTGPGCRDCVTSTNDEARVSSE